MGVHNSARPIISTRFELYFGVSTQPLIMLYIILKIHYFKQLYINNITFGLNK